jgi:hypothetical protein
MTASQRPPHEYASNLACATGSYPISMSGASGNPRRCASSLIAQPAMNSNLPHIHVPQFILYFSCTCRGMGFSHKTIYRIYRHLPQGLNLLSLSLSTIIVNQYCRCVGRVMERAKSEDPDKSNANGYRRCQSTDSE